MGNCAGCKPKDEDWCSERLRFISHVQLFQRLPKDQHPSLANAMDEHAEPSGSVIIKQGDEGDEFFVIKGGECSVEVDGSVVAKLISGDYFGENALLRDEPRTATIKAVTKVDLLTISRAKFEELGLHRSLHFPKRGAVGGGAAAQVEVKPPSPKSMEDEKLMREALRMNKNLQTMVTLDDAKINKMISLMWKETVMAGHEIIKQGDLNADYFYIVTDGSFVVQVMGQSADGAILTTLGPGQSFGELALMYFAPRAATVIAQSDATVMIIDRAQFKSILADAALQSAKKYIPYLDKVELLDPLKDEEKSELAKALHEMTFSKDESIFQQGEKGDLFYILIDGSVKVVKDGAEVAKLRGTEVEAQFFGERALLTNEPRAATVIVTSEKATALTVDKTSFDMLLGPLEELKERGRDGATEVAKMATTLPDEDISSRFGKIPRKELKKLATLGCGGFGVVELVEHTETGETYALKGLSKGYLVKSGMQASVVSEKRVQMMCDSTFIVKLYETYCGSQSLYLLLELALGGELYATYNKKNLWGQIACAKFYVAGTTFAFEHLHGKKIVFRDLKPENLLLNTEGHVKLTDMGLAKVCLGKTYTTCGTPDYFAPELIASKGHSHAVDWWTLGILTFELLSGHPPFESPSPMQTYMKVNKGIGKIRFPKKVQGDVESLIKGLCSSSPSERLPMKKGDTRNIKDHPWFAGFDWDAMANLRMEPPYTPSVKNNKDAGNFSVRKEDMPPQILYKDDGSGWDQDFATCK